MKQPLEDELKNALRRAEAPEGFAERVLAQVRQTSAKEHRPRWRFPAWPQWNQACWALAGGALCLLLLAVALRHHQLQQERARGEAAKARLMLALHITGDKLQMAQSLAIQHLINPEQEQED